ncbi:MAG TPA: FAD-binding oxidoreductase [Acidimicrobiales bacterium]|nr:FAD-binding oxidoreductase [Acidimicrobiales bacterium]
MSSRSRRRGGTADHPEIVTGWGRSPRSAARVVRATNPDELAMAVKAAGPRGAIARGLGASYGDAAMNAGGTVVCSTDVSGLLELDQQAGTARVLAGTSIADLLRAVVPRGWFVPVTPGTKHVTIGGAIAADVHGKDHHATGSLGAHVRSMVLALPDGTRRTLTPHQHPDEFWATCGGMGLTGTVIEATIGLHRIETSLLSVDSDRVPDFDTLLALLSEGGRRYRYSVAWVDVLARGRALGRAVLTQGDFARVDDVPDRRRRGGDALTYSPLPTLTAPEGLPSGILGRPTVRAFNELWYRKAPRHRRGELQTIDTFFYPLDMVRGWNRVYGRRGFLQWQCLVPFGQEDVLRGIVESLSGHQTPSFVSVLKYFGAADPGPLSFPGPGWTLTVDVPTGLGGLAELLDRLDRRVVDVGGRLYLAKESRMRPELVPAMYPRLDEWRHVRDRMDPDRRLVSDLARRLDLLG